MLYGYEGDLHSNLMTEILEYCAVKILGVVDCDVCDRFCFNPLREVLGCHNSKGVLALC
jgi:hypothetical protein